MQLLVKTYILFIKESSISCVSVNALVLSETEETVVSLYKFPDFFFFLKELILTFLFLLFLGKTSH